MLVRCALPISRWTPQTDEVFRGENPVNKSYSTENIESAYSDSARDSVTAVRSD
ncbi:hypothetical protein OK016_28725 [Vibrio chagasii]|nr:hypothetical protein [Vibrio chagasii]